MRFSACAVQARAEALEGNLFKMCSRGSIKTGVDVVNAKAQPVAEHACGADVGRNHRLFNDAVRNASRFGHDVQHFAFLAQNKAIVRAVFEHQRVGFTPFAAVQADAMQQTNLRGN